MMLVFVYSFVRFLVDISLHRKTFSVFFIFVLFFVNLQMHVFAAGLFYVIAQQKKKNLCIHSKSHTIKLKKTEEETITRKQRATSIRKEKITPKFFFVSRKICVHFVRKKIQQTTWVSLLILRAFPPAFHSIFFVIDGDAFLTWYRKSELAKICCFDCTWWNLCRDFTILAE